MGEPLTRVACVDRGSEVSGLIEIGRRGLEPKQIRVGSVGKRAGDRGLDTPFDHEVALGGAAAADERVVAGIDVGGESVALTASVRATTTVGTSSTSAARRAAMSVRMCWAVGTSTLPPR